MLLIMQYNYMYTHVYIKLYWRWRLILFVIAKRFVVGCSTRMTYDDNVNFVIYPTTNNVLFGTRHTIIHLSLDL